MLVLTRRIGEEIVIDGDIRVVALQANGPKVRLGITARPSVSVWRRELLAAGMQPLEPPTLATNPKDVDTPKER